MDTATITLNKSDKVGTATGVLSNYGLIASSTATYNSKTSLTINATAANATYYGYVKDQAGNTGSCNTTFAVVPSDPTMITGPNFQTTLATYKANITSVEFMNVKTQPSGTLVASYDVSVSQLKTVMAYVMQNGTGKYKLYIGGKGGVIANTNESTMFKDFTSLTEVKNLNYFNSSNTTNMSYMFYNTPKLATINLDQLNMTNVTNMSNIFNSYHIAYTYSPYTTCTTAECSIDELYERLS